MKYTDHHVHTSYSPDSEADIETYLIEAKKLGLDFVMFTDHVDIGTTDELFMQHINYEEYFAKMKILEKEYEIPIQVGVEIGYEKNHKNEIEEFLEKYQFDFVIASLHYGDGKDFYFGDFFHGKNQEESYMRYFEILLEMVLSFSNFDVVGHLDYITRYGPFQEKNYNYKVFEEIIDSILIALIEKGKGIELNTSGMRGELGILFPKEEVLQRYRELGGKIITLGSDSHFNAHYYAGILEGMYHLKSLGFNEISSFTKRKEKRLILSY